MAVTILYNIPFSAKSSIVVITTLNSVENEILYEYNIDNVIERGDRGECYVVFPSLTAQTPEEGGNKPPKCRLLIKKLL